MINVNEQDLRKISLEITLKYINIAHSQKLSTEEFLQKADAVYNFLAERKIK